MVNVGPFTARLHVYAKRCYNPCMEGGIYTEPENMEAVHSPV